MGLRYDEVWTKAASCITLSLFLCVAPCFPSSTADELKKLGLDLPECNISFPRIGLRVVSSESLPVLSEQAQEKNGQWYSVSTGPLVELFRGLIKETKLADVVLSYSPDEQIKVPIDLVLEVTIDKLRSCRVHSFWSGTTVTVNGHMTIRLVALPKRELLIAEESALAWRARTNENAQKEFGEKEFAKFFVHPVIRIIEAINKDEALRTIITRLSGARISSQDAVTGRSESRLPPSKGQANEASLPPRIRNAHILIIGIGTYSDLSIPRLSYTVSDAKAMYDFFKTSPRSPARPSNVHYVGDQLNEDGLRADKRGMMLAIDRYLVKKAAHKDDMAIFYFSGHGDTGKHPTKGTEYYLMPLDAAMDSLYVTAIELSEFQRMWNAIPANTKILIVDACNSGGFSGVKGRGGITGVDSISGEAKAVFSACKGDEKSIECPQLGHGLFTHVLLEGIKGKADMVCGNNDERVTLAELKRWLDQQVPLEARKVGGRQTPITSLVDAWGDVYLTR